jgi:hypothetical protein
LSTKPFLRGEFEIGRSRTEERGALDQEEEEGAVGVGRRREEGPVRPAVQ